MKLTCVNAVAFASDFTNHAEYLWLQDAVSFETKEWAPWRRTFISRITCLLDIRDNSLPIGLVPLVRQLAKASNVPVEIVNRRTRPGAEPDLAVFEDLARSLRTFQREGAERALKQSIGIIKAPTGSGKTLLAVSIMAAKQDINWVVFCPKDALVDQMAAEYELNLSEKPGVIKKGVWRPGRVTIMTYSQATSKSKSANVRSILEEADGYIIDEIHFGGEASRSVIELCRKAHYRIGLSATPLDRSDKKNILVVASTGPLIYEISTQELVDLKLISKPEIRFVRYFHDPDSSASRYSEPAAIYRHRIANNRERNNLIASVIDRAAKPCIAFVLRNEHVNTLYDVLQKKGMSVAAVDQRAHPERRKDVVNRLKSGTLDVCVASAVFQDGINVPNLASVVVATGYKSTIAALQRLGRGSRITDDKTSFEVWDIADEGAFGEKHTEARHKAYTREGYEAKFVTRVELEAEHVESVHPEGS